MTETMSTTDVQGRERENLFLLYEGQDHCPGHDSQNIKHLALSEYLRGFPSFKFHNVNRD